MTDTQNLETIKLSDADPKEIQDLFYEQVKRMTMNKEALLDLQFSDRWF